MYDPTINHLLQLEPRTQSLAYFLVSAVRQRGVPLIITSSRRSVFEQIGHVLAGRSKTFSSRHLSGRAFDVDVYGWNRKDVPRWFWDDLGRFAVGLGLKWPVPDWDPGHFEG